MALRLREKRKTRITWPIGSTVSAAARRRMRAWTLATAPRWPRTWPTLRIAKSNASHWKWPRRLYRRFRIRIGNCAGKRALLDPPFSPILILNLRYSRLGHFQCDALLLAIRNVGHVRVHRGAVVNVHARIRRLAAADTVDPIGHVILGFRFSRKRNAIASIYLFGIVMQCFR